MTGLHLMTGEGESGPSGGQCPDFGRHVERRLPKKAQIGTATANRGAKVKAFLRSINAGTMWKALLFMSSGSVGQARRCPFFQEDWELARAAFELPRCPGHVVPGNA